MIDPEEGIFHLVVSKRMLIELSSEPIMAVEVDLNRKGKPRLDSHMHETELRIDEVEIQAQTLAPGRDETGPFRCGDQLEALAGFHRCQDADEPFGDAIGISEGSGFFLLPDLPVEVEVGPAGLFGHTSRVLLEPFGMCAHEGFKILEEQTLVRHKTVHGLRPTDRQIALEKNPIKTGYRSRDFLCMLIDEVLRGGPPFVAVW
jgi:hypothetical protein